MKQRKPDRIWHSLPEFSVKNAAFLVCDVDPACQPTPEVTQVLQLLIEDYRREPHRLELASGNAVQSARRVRDLLGAPMAEEYFAHAQHFTDPNDAIVSRAEVSDWCRRRGVQSAFFGTTDKREISTTERNNLISLLGCLIGRFDPESTSKHAKAKSLSALTGADSRHSVSYKTIEKWMDEAAQLMKRPPKWKAPTSSAETREVSDD